MTEFGDNVVLAAGNVVFGDDVIYGFDAGTGQRNWVFDPQALGIGGYAPGAYELRTDGTVVFAGSGSGNVYAIRATNGSLIWIDTLATDGNTSVYSPVFDSASVYVTVRHFTNPITGAIYALDRRTGAVRWSHVFVPPPTPGSGSGPRDPMAVYNGLVISADDDGKIYALDAATGAERWVAPRLPNVPGLDDFRWIVRAGEVVVAGSTTLLLTGYDAATGHQLWQVPSPQGSSANPLATDGTYVYVTFNNGVLGSFNATTGAQRWLRSAPGGGVYMPYPIIASDAVFAPSTAGLVALKK